MLVYLTQGAMGLPVFVGGAGLAYMAGPTGGYLAGFVVAVLITGYAAQYIRARIGVLLAVVVADAALLTLGVAYLSTLIGLEAAIAGGLAPFVYGEVLKVALALGVAWASLRATSRT